MGLPFALGIGDQFVDNEESKELSLELTRVGRRRRGGGLGLPKGGRRFDGIQLALLQIPQRFLIMECALEAL